MSSGVVIERPADKDIGRFFRQEDPSTFPPEPCDPPDGGGGTGGELPGEEIVDDHSEPPEED